jgi:1-acyl-sn-glycerol-3-phosphate acyltransferase
MFWWLMKHVLLGPFLRLFFHPEAEGLENIPEEGGAILAGNHQSFLDNVLMPLVIPDRKVVFLGKSEYFEKWYMRWFFKGAAMIPIKRGGGSASEAALDTAVEALREGKLIGIFPEGTRSPDGRLYRGKSGVARMALEAGVPVIPVGITGTFEAMPYHRKIPRLHPVIVRFGAPLTFERYREMPGDRFLYRAVTDEIVYEIMMLTGQEYTDEDATRVKKSMERRRSKEADAPEAAEESSVQVDAPQVDPAAGRSSTDAPLTSDS